jgi:hypothetical protein
MKLRPRMNASCTVGIGLVAILLVPAKVFGQGKYGPPGTTYAAEAARYPGAASKPTPKQADGHPDLNGVWHHFLGGLVAKVGESSFTLDFARSFGGGSAAKPGGPRPPSPTPDPLPEYKKEFLGKVKELSDNQINTDRTLHCMPPGVPRIGPPHQIVHTPKQAVFLYADFTGNHWRAIPLDGRAHSTDPEAEGTYNGDSVGHWEGDTLVVDVTRMTDETWLGDNGLFHSNKLHVVERLRRVGDTIEYQMTADDPVVLAKPWTLYRTMTLQPDTLEEVPPCVDNDAGHYVNRDHHDNGR